MRNKAAEKAKISGYGSGGCTSPDLTPGLSHESHTSLRHPSYSINGILGIHQQQDANANIQSRKREAEGKWSEGWGNFDLMLTCSDEKGQGRLQEEDCKRFRSQYDPALYSSMWSGKWGSIPHIKEEKSASQTVPEQSPTHSESQYGSNFPAGSAAFTGTNTSQASNEILYETMSQVYPALSSSLGRVTSPLSSWRNIFISLNFSFFKWLQQQHRLRLLPLQPLHSVHGDWRGGGDLLQLGLSSGILRLLQSCWRGHFQIIIYYRNTFKF